MAVDTAQKRGSSIGIAGPPVLPAADGTIDADDRRMTALSYSSEFAKPDAICFDASAQPALSFDAKASPAVRYSASAQPEIDFDGKVGCN